MLVIKLLGILLFILSVLVSPLCYFSFGGTHPGWSLKIGGKIIWVLFAIWILFIFIRGLWL